MLRRLLPVFFLLPLSLKAHHSAATFDLATAIRVQGVITSVHFANPHSVIFVEEQTADGKRVRWAIENSGTLAMTQQRGLNEASLKPGSAIEVCGYAPKRSVASLRESLRADPSRQRPAWYDAGDRVLTGRLLKLATGPAEDWSHYGPLEQCKELLGVE